MKYSDIRKDLKTGDILLFNGRGFVSWLIKLATASDVSHVGMVYVIGGDVYCWESTSMRKGADGVQISLLSNRINNYNGTVKVRHLVTERDSAFYEALKIFRDEVKGRKYEQNIWELMGAAMPWRNKSNLKTIFCSELIAEMFKRWGFLIDGFVSNEYTPNDFSFGKRVDHDIRLSDEPVCLGKEILIEKGGE